MNASLEILGGSTLILIVSLFSNHFFDCFKGL